MFIKKISTLSICIVLFHCFIAHAMEEQESISPSKKVAMVKPEDGLASLKDQELKAVVKLKVNSIKENTTYQTVYDELTQKLPQELALPILCQVLDKCYNLNIAGSTLRSTMGINDISLIQHLPKQLKEKITTINLVYNEFPTLPSNVFVGFNALKEIFLSSNKIATISENAFSGIANQLTKIDLRFNNLTSISENVFKNVNPEKCTLLLYGNQVYRDNQDLKNARYFEKKLYGLNEKTKEMIKKKFGKDAIEYSGYKHNGR